MTLRSIPLLALAFWALSCSVSPYSASGQACDLVAAPTGSDAAPGSVAAPLRTPQRIVDRLRPGQTGCLRGGTYAARSREGYIARFGHGGRKGAPLTLRSYPGETARLAGVVYVPHGSDRVTISDVTVDDPTPFSRAGQITVQINAASTVLARVQITNGSRKSCIILGAGGAGRARKTVIRDSILRDCGDPANRMHDHAIYASAVTGLRVENNLIEDAGGWGVHLYPDAQRSRVRRNVFVGNGGGVIFAGEGSLASSRNLVERNVIVNSKKAPDIDTYWGDRIGRRNLARGNCLGGETGRTAGLRLRANFGGDVLDAGASVSSSCTRVLGDTVAALASRLSVLAG